MTQRNLLIGIAAAALVLTAALFISAKSNSDGRPDSPVVVEVTSNPPKANAPAAVTATSPTTAPTAAPTATATDSRAILAVQGMSCSGCINQIKAGLSGIEGIGDILVDLSAGRVEVNYDSGKLKDTDRIASAITDVGYPATVQRTLSKEDIARQDSFFASRSKLYIAAVGDWEISREDYNTELAHARKRYESIYGKNVFDGDQGTVLLQRLKSQIVSRLIDEGIQMQEILKAGYKLPPKVVDREFDTFLAAKGISRDQFERMLADSGYSTDYFMKKFEQRITVERYVQETVLSGVMSDLEKQKQAADWFNNARLLSQVTYYDRELEAIVKAGAGSSGCGSSCGRKQSS